MIETEHMLMCLRMEDKELLLRKTADDKIERISEKL